MLSHLKITKTILFIPLILLFCSCHKNSQVTEKRNIKKDSIASWIQFSYAEEYSKKEKKLYLTKAYNQILSSNNDSINTIQLSEIAYRFYELKDSINFFKSNEKTLEVAVKRKDSFSIADAYWNYAYYYINNEIYDKAYYYYSSALPLFEGIKDEYRAARMLYSMSFIKGRYKDYSGSEVLIIEAIKKFKKLDNLRLLFDSYNNLATIQIDIKEYEKALNYYDVALSYLEKLKNKDNLKSIILNNIGFTYLSSGSYNKALSYFEKALNNNKTKINFARIITNRAYTKLLVRDTIGIEKDFLTSLRLRDSLNDVSGVLSTKIRLSEYYEYIGDTTTAIQYAKEANQLAKKIKNGGDYLTSLEQLGDLEPERANEYLKLYSRFSDSLSNAERKTLNKFTRIEFETDEVLAQNKTLGQRMTWIISGSAALLIVLSLLYFIRVQRVKNEKLFLETEQQKANEQVYLLTLKQQATLEEEKARERNRISQELHDGILGRLFGTRVGLGFLELEADEKTQQQHEAFLDELQDIEKEIREVSHKLNDNFASTDVNFTTIITQLLESKSQIGGFQYHLSIDEQISWKSVDEVIKVNVYRIIQETLQNAIKHANAKNITLDFSSTQNELQIQIHDDGNGFNMKKSKKGIGLKNMKSRVEKLNGSITISSAMNKGTQIHIKIPHI